MIVTPTMERVDIPRAEIENALKRLTLYLQTPDGNELTDMRMMPRHRKTIALGYYNRIVFPPDTTREQAHAWFDMAERVIEFHRAGLL